MYFQQTMQLRLLLRSLWPKELVITFVCAVSARSSSAIKLYELDAVLPINLRLPNELCCFEVSTIYYALC